MVALATAFVALAPTLNKARFVGAGQQAGLAAGQGAGTGFGKGFDKGAQPVFKSMKSTLVGASNLLVPLALAGAVAKIFTIGTAYEDNLNILQAVTKASGVEMDKVGAKARELGADFDLPGVSAQGAAEAMTELAKAGFTVQESMDAAKGTLQLARIANISEADASMVAAAAVNAFGIEARDTTFVVDQLAAAANSSSVDINDVDLAFRQASATFSGFQGPAVGSKEAITELNTAIAILGNNGIRGSDAGTSLKQMLLQLTGPTERAKVVMEELALRAGGANVTLQQQTDIIQGSKKVRDKSLEDIKKGNKAIQDQGDIAYDASGKMRSLPEVLDLVTRGTKGMTDENKNAIITQIFGADATRSIIALMKGGLPVYDMQRKKVLQQGAAADFARAKNIGLKGALDNVRSQLENIAIELYLQVKGPLRDAFVQLAEFLAPLPDKIHALSQFVRENAGTFKFLAQVLGTVLLSIIAYRAAVIAVIAVTRTWLALQTAIAFVQLASQVRTLADAWALLSLRTGAATTRLGAASAALAATGPAGAKAAVGMNAAAAGVGKLVLILGALQVAAIVFDHLDRQSVSVDKMRKSLETLANTGKTTGELTDNFGKDLKGLGLSADIANSKFFGWLNNVEDSVPILGSAAKAFINFGGRIAVGTDFETSKRQFAGLDEALVKFETTTKDAGKAGDLWNQILVKSKLDTGELAKLLPNAWKGLQDLQTAAHAVKAPMTEAAQAQANMARETKAVSKAAKGQIQDLQQLNEQLHAANDPTFAFIAAQRAVKKAQQEATAAIKEHGKKSVEAKDAELALAGAALDLQDKASKLAQGFNGKLSPAFVKTLKAAGLTKSQIAEVAKQFADAKKSADKYDGNYKANTTAPGAKKANDELKNAYKAATDFDGNYKAFMSTPGGKQAETQVNKAWTNLKGFDGNWVANMSTKNYAKVAGDLRHLLAAQQALKDNTSVNEANRELGHFFARGGKVPGSSPSPTADNIRAWLTAGEFVQPVASVDYYGTAFMEAVRQRRIPRGDAAALAAYAGGGTVMPYPTNVKGTKIPEVAFPGGTGPTDSFIIRAVHSAFPGLNAISTFRPGARTLSGNVSYHSLHRAVDWPASRPLAEWWNAHFLRATKEFISPWNSLNIHNGARHAYTGAIYRQHSGANAHDHIAMKYGGVVPKMQLFDKGGYWPSGTMGVNLSGRTEYVDPHGGGGVNLTIINHGVIGVDDAQEWFEDAYKKAKRRRKV